MSSKISSIVHNEVEEYEVKEILDSQKYQGKLQYLINWKGYPSEENSWEPATTIKEDVPHLVTKFHKEHSQAVQSISPTIPNFFLPVKQLSEDAAGLDLCSAEVVY